MPQRDLRILQVNANRSRIVMDEVRAAVRHLGCQVVAVSEPNLAALEHLDYYMDSSQGATIVDIDGVLSSAVVKICSGFFMAIKPDLVIISVYFSPNIFMEEYRGMLDELNVQLRRICNRRIVVCGDFNAKNHAWGGCFD